MTDKEPEPTAQDMLVALLDLASDGMESQTDQVQDCALELIRRHKQGEPVPDLKAALDEMVERVYVKPAKAWEDVLKNDDD